MRLRLLAAATAMFVFSLAAHADNVTVYNIDAPLVGGGELVGQFAYDSTNVFASTFLGTITSNVYTGAVPTQTAPYENYSYNPDVETLGFLTPINANGIGYGFGFAFLGNTVAG